jgi:hypothetical protein
VRGITQACLDKLLARIGSFREPAVKGHHGGTFLASIKATARLDIDVGACFSSLGDLPPQFVENP